MKKIEIQTKYWHRARLASFLLQFMPFIRMIGLNGSLARGEASERSDIDLIIIAKPGRIWTCRFFSILIMMIFGLKRYENKIAGRICLNLYQTTDKLELSIKTTQLARNHSFTKLLWQENDIFKVFKQKNQWIQDFGYDFQDLGRISVLANTCSKFIFIFRKINELIFDLFFSDLGERVLGQYQKNRILKDQRTIRAKSGQIFISSKELRFHPDKI
ncbi:MAG: nucleotidyltransferase domain-containing protein [Candidatus Berkelbacteria bacterium]